MKKWILSFMLIAMPGLVLAAEKPDEKKSENTRVDYFFKGVDLNNDGKISKEEAKQKAPAITENFDQIDANHDGSLNKKEFKAFWAAAEKNRRDFSQRLEQADLDKNNRLSKEEANALPTLSARFDDIDRNHDGQLVIKEISDYLRAQASAGNASTTTAQ